MKEVSKKGFLFEQEVAEKLKGRGFSHIKITKASRDYGADILAFKDGLEYVFQCKKYKGTVGFHAVKDITTAMDIYQADKGVLVCDTQFFKAVYKAVERIEKPIELADLEEIRSWKSEKIEALHYRPHSYQKKILSSLIKHRERETIRQRFLFLQQVWGKRLLLPGTLEARLKKDKKRYF